MIVEQSFVTRNTSGDVITGDVRYEQSRPNRPVIIVCHGFTAHKDWGPFPYFGRRFAEFGFVSLVFNFSHNGIGRDPSRFTEFERFSRNTISKELEDVAAVVGAVTAGKVGEEIADVSRVGVAGHSRGGGVAIVAASRNKRIRAVASLSGVSTFYRYTEHQEEVWEKQGHIPVTIKGSRTRLKFGIEVLRDLQANREAYDIRKAVQELEVPLLLVHGNADVSVKPKEAEELYAVAEKSRTELILLDHVGHMYGARHPFRPNPTVDHITEITAQWFHLHL